MKQPFLYMNGANDGFHEAIGDAIALSVTPAYLVKAGLLDRVPPANEKALINVQLKAALEKVSFLPFGKDIDQWRWQVFSGKVTPGELRVVLVGAARRRTRASAPPVPRTEADFDPGAKYHVPANVPYTRYFLARMLQFQFYRALCRAAGQTGPLHTCSFDGSKEAGRKLQAMLALGASKPWPDALAGAHRRAAHRWRGAAGVLRAAPELAQGAEQGPHLRVVRCRRDPVQPFFLEKRVDSGGRSSYVAARRSSHDGRDRWHGGESPADK